MAVLSCSLSKNLILCIAVIERQGGARGGEARLELDQMPRKALRSKACGERSENFVLRSRWRLCRLTDAAYSLRVLQSSTKFRHYFRLSKESEWTFLTA